MEGRLHPVRSLGRSYSGWLTSWILSWGEGLEIAEVEGEHVLSVHLGGYGLNDLLLVE